MSNPPDVVTGDLEAPDESTQQAPPAGSKQEASERRRTHDLWMSGTEPRDFAEFTDEGAQEMLEDESPEILAGQRGTLVSDDYERPSGAADDERQIINMGPQHPATHGVLRLHIELDGSQTLDEAHAIGARVRRRILSEVPRSEVIVHKDPVLPDGTVR